MSRAGPRISPAIWCLYILYVVVMYLIATDFHPFQAPPPTAEPPPKPVQRQEGRPFDIAIPCTLSPLRTATVYLPKGHVTAEQPDIVICFHSKGRSGLFAATKQTGWTKVADETKVTVMFGSSTGMLSRMGGPQSRWKSEAVDFEYFRGLLLYAANNLAKNNTRIFITGIANGGFFASDLVQRYPSMIAGAYLAMAGLGRTTELGRTTPLPPIAFAVGSKDPMRPKVEAAANAYKEAHYPTKLMVLPDVSFDYQPDKEQEVLGWLREMSQGVKLSPDMIRAAVASMVIQDLEPMGSKAA